MRKQGRLSIALTAIAGCACLGAGFFFFDHTLVEWWLPVVVAIAAALVVTGLLIVLLASKGKSYDFLTVIGSFLFSGSIAYATFLGGNYLFASESSLHDEKVTVECKYSKEKHSGGGGRYNRGPRRTYYTYHLLVEFPSGRQKEIDVPLERFNRIRNGSTLTLQCRKGLFGMTVWREKRL